MNIVNMPLAASPRLVHLANIIKIDLTTLAWHGRQQQQGWGAIESWTDIIELVCDAVLPQKELHRGALVMVCSHYDSFGLHLFTLRLDTVNQFTLITHLMKQSDLLSWFVLARDMWIMSLNRLHDWQELLSFKPVWQQHVKVTRLRGKKSRS